MVPETKYSMWTSKSIFINESSPLVSTARLKRDRNLKVKSEHDPRLKGTYKKKRPMNMT